MWWNSILSKSGKNKQSSVRKNTYRGFADGARFQPIDAPDAVNSSTDADEIVFDRSGTPVPASRRETGLPQPGSVEGGAPPFSSTGSARPSRPHAGEAARARAGCARGLRAARDAAVLRPAEGRHEAARQGGDQPLRQLRRRARRAAEGPAGGARGSARTAWPRSSSCRPPRSASRRRRRWSGRCSTTGTG